MHAHSIRVVPGHSGMIALLSMLFLSSTHAAKAALAEHGRVAERSEADCAAAMKIVLPNARVTEVHVVQPNDSLRAIGHRAYCSVAATVDAETHIVAMLPDNWNGQFLMGGGGGYVGAVENQSATAVHEGYATVGTDAGHTAFSLSAAWALHNDTRVSDWAYRAVHRTAEVTKVLIEAYYGRPPEHSYFFGCSNGGREALMEAQRYPADFDGIVAIAPAYNFLAIAATFVRNAQAQYPTGDFNTPVVTPAVLKLLAARVSETCDATDGVRDGTIENPEACTFRLASLPPCPGDIAADNCVTRMQRAALSTFTAPLTAGAVHYPGQPFGDEADPDAWNAWITGPVQGMQDPAGRTPPTVQGVFGTEFFKYFIYGDSTWRYVGYDLARAARDGAKVDAIVSATNPDLSAFRARGGKLLLAHGWSDPALNARSTIEYFNAVQARTPQASSFSRLFMMPGVLHCAGGSGCDDVDWIKVIRRWVEAGDAPSRIVARKLRGTQVVRTHPLCAYPMTARYGGTGSTDDAAAFACQR